MKLLIIDDNSIRVEKILKMLATLDEQNISIETQSIEYAKDIDYYLTNNYYDLVIIDVLLPFSIHSKSPSSEYSLNILEQLNDPEEKLYKKPSKIIGITSDGEIHDQVEDNFKKYTWTLIKCIENQDSWLEQIKNSIIFISKNINKKPNSYEVDLAIICALEIELKAILDLPWNWSKVYPLTDSIFVNKGKIEFLENGSKLIYSVIALKQLEMGSIETAILTTNLINSCRPKIIAMTGICAGAAKSSQIGDLIFASESWDFSGGKYLVNEEGQSKFLFGHNRFPIEATMKAKIHQFNLDLLKQYTIAFLAKFSGNKFSKFNPNYPIQVCAPIASSAAVIADRKIINNLINFNDRNIRGIDMEICGLYAAVYYSSLPKPQVFAVKCVSDLGDSSKDDNFHDFAANISAIALRVLVEQFHSSFFNDE